MPSEADIIACPPPTTTGVRESRATFGQLTLVFTDVGAQRSERKKWIRSFENVTSIIFVVDLAQYDLEEEEQNRLMERLVLFDSIVNSRWFMRSSIILLLDNIGAFQEKLAKRPLEIYFPDYSGGNNVNRAAKYILWRFNQVNRAHLDLYPHVIDSIDSINLRLVYAAIKETIVENAMKKR